MALCGAKSRNALQCGVNENLLLRVKVCMVSSEPCTLFLGNLLKGYQPQSVALAHSESGLVKWYVLVHEYVQLYTDFNFR